MLVDHDRHLLCSLPDMPSTPVSLAMFAVELYWRATLPTSIFQIEATSQKHPYRQESTYHVATTTFGSRPCVRLA